MAGEQRASGRCFVSFLAPGGGVGGWTLNVRCTSEAGSNVLIVFRYEILMSTEPVLI